MNLNRTLENFSYSSMLYPMSNFVRSSTGPVLWSLTRSPRLLFLCQSLPRRTRPPTSRIKHMWFWSKHVFIFTFRGSLTLLQERGRLYEGVYGRLTLIQLRPYFCEEIVLHLLEFTFKGVLVIIP